jgi:hypothetical protein
VDFIELRFVEHLLHESLKCQACFVNLVYSFVHLLESDVELFLVDKEGEIVWYFIELVEIVIPDDK